MHHELLGLIDTRMEILDNLYRDYEHNNSQERDCLLRAMIELQGLRIELCLMLA